MGGAERDAWRIVSKLVQPHTSWYCAALLRRHPAAGLRGVLVLREVVALALPAFGSDTQPNHFSGVGMLHAPAMNALASLQDTTTIPENSVRERKQ